METSFKRIENWLTENCQYAIAYRYDTRLKRHWLSVKRESDQKLFLVRPLMASDSELWMLFVVEKSESYVMSESFLKEFLSMT
jgi:hypothetical protein